MHSIIISPLAKYTIEKFWMNSNLSIRISSQFWVLRYLCYLVDCPLPAPCPDETHVVGTIQVVLPPSTKLHCFSKQIPIKLFLPWPTVWASQQQTTCHPAPAPARFYHNSEMTKFIYLSNRNNSLLIFVAISSTNDQEDTVNGWNTFIFFPQQTFLVVCVAVSPSLESVNCRAITEQRN